MSVTTYIPSSDKIIHKTSVDFVKRMVNSPIFLVQYDETIPLIEIELLEKTKQFVIPNNANINVRWSKRDGTNVYKPVLGCNESRTSIYIDIDRNMSAIPGTIYPILELIINNGIAGTQNFQVNIERNPIDDTNIVSENDISSLLERIRILESKVNT